mmetsp:Transcript_98846/g.307980  ORF Transcript_98846/g.307980 Transcript_98846/m.307980 type:complete len:691 (+) Transcript_98846:567-2639(+)
MNHSLVSRVCALDKTLEVSTDQASTVGLIRKYLPGIDPFHSTEDIKGWMQDYLDGRVMCLIAMSCWILTVGKEIGSIGNLLGAIFMLPSSNSASIEVARAEDGSAQVVGARGRFKAFMVFLCLMRLAIAVLLLIMGCQYLAYTSSMQDLLLNAVALECVFSIDELIFEAMAPRRARLALAKLAPLKSPPWPRWPALDLRGATTFLGLVVLLVILGNVSIVVHVNNLKEAHSVLCDGNQDFSIVTDALGMVHYSPSTAFDPDKQGEVQGLKTLAVKELLEGNAPSSWLVPSSLRYALQPEMYSYVTADLPLVKRSSVADLTQTLYGDLYRFFFKCHDALDLPLQDPNDNKVLGPGWEFARSHWQVFRNQRRVWLSYLNFGGGSGRTCPDFRHRCSEQLVVSLCPVTCGCHTLLGGFFEEALHGGCPLVCRQNVGLTDLWATTLASARTYPWDISCKDANRSDPQDPKWLAMQAWAEEVEAPMKPMFLGGCGNITTHDLDVLCVSPSWMRSSTPMRTAYNSAAQAVYKLITHVCPEACNCKGVAKTGKWTGTATAETCPSICTSCPWAFPPSISQPSKVVSTCALPQFLNNSLLPVQASGECCFLLQTNVRLMEEELLLGNLRTQAWWETQYYWQGSMCHYCWDPCWDLLFSLQVAGKNLTYVELYAAEVQLPPSAIDKVFLCNKIPGQSKR